MTFWNELPLGEVASIERVGVDPTEVPQETLYIGLENIERGGRIINVISTGKAGVDSQKYRFSKEHLLFGKLRPYLGKIARPHFDGICSTDILPILPGPKLDRNYLSHFLSQPHMVMLASSRSTGANLPRLSPSELAKFSLPLPPLSEQRRIAEVLDHIDLLRTKRRKTISLLDDLAKSIFLDMFVSHSEHWPLATVGEVAAEHKNSIRTGPFGSQLLHEEFVEEGIAVLGIDNAVANEFRWDGRRYITEVKYRQLARYTVHPGDVLITIMGTCGRCAIVPVDIPVAINTKHLCCITLDPKKCLPEFLHSYFLQHPDAHSYLQQAAKGAIMAGLNMSIIKALPIPLAPMHLQQEYAVKRRALQAAKAKHLKHLVMLDELFASAQQRAFRGKLWNN